MNEKNDALGNVTICLVGGTRRSGTTLLREIFAKHPRVATFPTETCLLTAPDGLVDFYDGVKAGWSPYVYDMKLWRLQRLLHDLGRSEFALGYGRPSSPINRQQESTSGWNKDGRIVATLRDQLKSSRLLPRYFNVSLGKSCKDYERLVDTLISNLTDFSFKGRWTGFPRGRRSTMLMGPPPEVDVAGALGDFFRDLMLCRAVQSRGSHVVEDSPFNHVFFNRILDLVPKARLVHIYRDPRDVVASMTKRVWAPSDPEEAANVYLRLVGEWERVRASLPVDSFKEISLEALSQRTESVLDELCSFWDLPWSEKLMSVDVSLTSSGRWQTDLGRAAIPVQKILSRQLESLGYEPE